MGHMLWHVPSVHTQLPLSSEMPEIPTKNPV